MRSRSGDDLRDPNQLDRLVQEITVDAYGDDEKLWAFRQVLEDEVTVPCDGYVIGEPVCLLGFDYDGNVRRGLTARCRRQDGSEHVVAAGEVALPAHCGVARHLAAYRKWLGLDPFPLEAGTPSPPRRQHKAIAGDLDLNWGQDGEPIQEWARPIVARGPRPMFEMEQVVPGTDPGDFDFDPIEEANELYDAGDAAAARKVLMELCQADLRCLDAHAHLGAFAFDYSAEDAIRHYQVGVDIGRLSLPAGFDGLLLWGHINNRPFLRCLKGHGLCLWRLNRFEEAGRVFDRMLWLNPADNQGARFLIEEVRAGRTWTA